MATYSKGALQSILGNSKKAPTFLPINDGLKVSPVMMPLPDRVTPGSLVPLATKDFSNNRELRDQSRLQQGYDKLGVISDMSNDSMYPSSSDYLERAEDIMFQANQVNQQAQQMRLQQALNPVIQGMGGGGGGKFGNFLRAISKQESGGNYGAVNSSSGAMGKYQIMPANIAGPGGWDMEALGRNITPQQFQNTPRLQEKIARYKLRQYFQKYGARGAASAWFSGGANNYKTNPAVNSYVTDILKYMGL